MNTVDYHSSLPSDAGPRHQRRMRFLLPVIILFIALSIYSLLSNAGSPAVNVSAQSAAGQQLAAWNRYDQDIQFLKTAPDDRATLDRLWKIIRTANQQRILPLTIWPTPEEMRALTMATYFAQTGDNIDRQRVMEIGDYFARNYPQFHQISNSDSLTRRHQ